MVLKDVSVALDWTLNTNHAGFVVARALGYYNEEGLSVSLMSPVPLMYPLQSVFVMGLPHLRLHRVRLPSPAVLRQRSLDCR